MRQWNFVFWRIPAPDLPLSSSIRYEPPVWIHTPNWIQAQGEGWEIVSYQVVGPHASGDVIMSAMLSRDIATDDLDTLEID